MTKRLLIELRICTADEALLSDLAHRTAAQVMVDEGRDGFAALFREAQTALGGVKGPRGPNTLAVGAPLP
jgi:hypothetical protein